MSLKNRLAALENRAAPGQKYWCEITESVVIFHGPGKSVILPAKESNEQQAAPPIQSYVGK